MVTLISLLCALPVLFLVTLADFVPKKLGVHPSDERVYAARVIQCKDGSKSFGRELVNDDFCDCVDGTDEPGTSACSNGKFYCKNVGGVPRLIFSSRVNDGICDCCDGSDEYSSGIACPDVCLIDGLPHKHSFDSKVSRDLLSDLLHKTAGHSSWHFAYGTKSFSAGEAPKKASSTDILPLRVYSCNCKGYVIVKWLSAIWDHSWFFC